MEDDDMKSFRALCEKTISDPGDEEHDHAMEEWCPLRGGER